MIVEPSTSEGCATYIDGRLAETFGFIPNTWTDAENCRWLLDRYQADHRVRHTISVYHVRVEADRCTFRPLFGRILPAA